jgi:hypothetical protein
VNGIAVGHVEFICPIAHNLNPFKSITYSLSTEKLVSKFAFQMQPAALHRGGDDGGGGGRHAPGAGGGLVSRGGLSGKAAHTLNPKP